MTTRRLRVGFVGAGIVGQIAHMSSFAEIADCEMAGLAELRPDLGAAAQRKFGIPKLFPDHRTLLADPSIDAVVVVTRRPATGPIVLDALRAGKHVLSEKPMAHTVDQALRLAEAAARAGRHYQVGFMKRFDAGALAARERLHAALADGTMGALCFVRCHCHGGEFLSGTSDFVMSGEIRPEGLELWPVAPDWLPAELHERYAWFLNVYVHDLNLLRWTIERPLEVRYADLTRARGMVVAMDCGLCPVVLEAVEGKFDEWKEGVEFVFERGRIALTFASPMLRNATARLEVERHRLGVERPAIPHSWAFRRQAEAFVAACLRGGGSAADGADSVEDLRLAEAIWRAHPAAARR